MTQQNTTHILRLDTPGTGSSTVKVTVECRGFTTHQARDIARGARDGVLPLLPPATSVESEETVPKMGTL